MLWVDRFRPHTFDKFVVHADTGLRLQRMVSEGDCPHLLLYGPSGAGKKTLALALLRELFGPSAEKLKVEGKTWKLEVGSRKVDLELTTVSSNNHVELNPSDAGSKDRYVVQEVIKEMAKSRPLDVTGNRGYKLLLLNEVDKLSKEAQHSLRRTMERYSASCRLVLVCNNVSKVLDAVRSRCVAVRVPAPSAPELEDLLMKVAKKEGLTLPPELCSRVVLASDRNMRRALLMLEACKAQQYPFTPDQPVQLADWELYVNQIAGEMMQEQSPKRVYQIRGRLYELLVNCIPPELILKRLTAELLRKLDAELKHEVAHWAAFYEHRLQSGQKPIFHLEAFVARFMALYRSFLVSTFG